MPLRSGILEGLSNNVDLVNAETFFGFVKLASSLFNSEQSHDLLDFGLARFELHIDDDFADGQWSDWLVPPQEISTAFAGFVWSALGSPRAKTRWEAAHCVRRLAEANCEPEIDELIKWLEKDTVDAFGSHKFPFYNLHARLYLLIALARVSIDHPQAILRHKSTFIQHALVSIEHILIKKFAADIALNIEKAFPNTYSEDTVKQLSQVCVSQFPVKQIKYGKRLNSYRHAKARGKIDTSSNFDHAFDFDRYWFEPLGQVFGISGKQVEELATEVVVKEWGIRVDVSHKNDPRFDIWRSRAHERETWHDNGHYPSVDDYNFYLSYHALLVVAANLLREMPVVRNRDWYEDEWFEWLHRHFLTRIDGRWLADRRDPAPLLRPRWISQDKTKNWISEISSNDFLDTILGDKGGETWLNVFGSWDEADYDCYETTNVSSALVCPELSQSLLNALSSFPSANDFYLPESDENDSDEYEDIKFNSYPFVLNGWILHENTSAGIDKYDPHASQIGYPPYQVQNSTVSLKGLTADSEQRTWSLPDENGESLRCEIWCSNVNSREDDPDRRGNRLSASLAFLKNLLEDLGCELVFKVQISRRFKRNSHLKEKDNDGYKPPKFKIYILSADGRFRGTKADYKLREKTCQRNGFRPK